jgi:hypothetical protein
MFFIQSTKVIVSSVPVPVQNTVQQTASPEQSQPRSVHELFVTLPRQHVTVCPISGGRACTRDAVDFLEYTVILRQKEFVSKVSVLLVGRALNLRPITSISNSM